MADIHSLCSGLTLGADGIWHGADEADVSYPVDGHHGCLAVEDQSFWFRHRNACITAAVAAHPPDDHGTIFDIGGGNGFVALALARSGHDVVLVEPGRSGAAAAKRRGLPQVVCATTVTAGFHPRSLPAVGLFDVIEHLADDVAFLRMIGDLMPPGGRLYATVPAYPFLWSADDITAGHFRRYTCPSIARALMDAGFDVDFSTHFFRFLPLPIFALRTIPFRLGWASKRPLTQTVERDHAVQGGLTASLLHALLRTEVGTIARGRVMAWGASCLVVARRRG